MTTEVEHLMIDIETFGTSLTSIVASIAAVPFTIFGDTVSRCDSFSARLHLGEQLSRGRTIDSSTLVWWNQQDENARDNAFLGVDYFSISSMRLRDFLSPCDFRYFWCKGPAFDAAMIDSLFESFGEKSPFAYYRWRDVRTMCDGIEKPEFVGTMHDPYDDCVNQIQHIRKAWRIRNRQPVEYGN